MRVYATYVLLTNSKGIKQTIVVDPRKEEVAYIYLGDGLNNDTVVYKAEEDTYIHPHCTVVMYTPRED